MNGVRTTICRRCRCEVLDDLLDDIKVEPPDEPLTVIHGALDTSSEGSNLQGRNNFPDTLEVQVKKEEWDEDIDLQPELKPSIEVLVKEVRPSSLSEESGDELYTEELGTEELSPNEIRRIILGGQERPPVEDQPPQEFIPEHVWKSDLVGVLYECAHCSFSSERKGFLRRHVLRHRRDHQHLFPDVVERGRMEPFPQDEDSSSQGLTLFCGSSSFSTSLKNIMDNHLGEVHNGRQACSTGAERPDECTVVPSTAAKRTVVQYTVVQVTVAEPTTGEPTVVELTVADTGVAKSTTGEPTVVEFTVADSGLATSIVEPAVAESTAVGSAVADVTVKPTVVEPPVVKPPTKPVLRVNYQCSHCWFSSRRKTLMRKHIVTEHKDKLHHFPKRTAGSPVVDVTFKPTVAEPPAVKPPAKPILRVQYQCSHCWFSSKRKALMRKHIVKKHKDEHHLFPSVEEVKEGDPAVYLCGVCRFSTSLRSDMKRHVQRAHRDNMAEEARISVMEQEYIEEVERLLSQRLVQANGMTKCQLCDHVTDKKCNMRRHLLVVHKRLRRYFCTLCNYRAGQRSHLKNHIEVVHRQVPREFKCHLCGFTTVCKNYLSLHVSKVHEGKKKLFPCSRCSYVADTERFLRQHVAVIHDKKKMFGCGYCNYRSGWRSHMRLHVRYMHEETERRFCCNLCNYKGRRKCDLKNHIRYVHEKKKDFPCEHCKYIACSKMYLRVHTATVHEGRKDLSCRMCDYITGHLSNLKRHIRSIHERNLAFWCHLCNYKCSMQRYIQKHVAQVHHIDIPSQPVFKRHKVPTTPSNPKKKKNLPKQDDSNIQSELPQND